MPLKESTIADLDAEYDSLAKTIEQAQRRQAAIDLIRGNHSEPAPKRRSKNNGPRRGRTAKPIIQPPPANVTADGFRPTIRAVMKRRGHIPASAVIKSLREIGFETKGKTPLTTRVYNELKRMWIQNQLTRDDQGAYALRG